METYNYQYDLLKRLPCPRFSGTQGERNVARFLQEEISSLGGESELMPFDIPAYVIQRCVLTVNGEAIDCAVIGHSGQLPEGGLELPLKYLESTSETAFHLLGDVSGCAVLINTLDVDMYRELVRRKAAAIIQIEQGKWYGVQALLSYEMRPRFLNIGHIPAVTIRAGDAMKLLRDCTASVHLELRQRSFTATAYNVLATVEGINPEEAVVLTAHYDTTEFSPGAWDNGSGAVTLMYIYRHFLAHTPKRTMHFIWCGAEEQGLLGSKAYVAAHEAILPQLRLCYNLDSCGTILGENCIDIAGSEEPKALTEHIC